MTHAAWPHVEQPPVTGPPVTGAPVTGAPVTNPPVTGPPDIRWFDDDAGPLVRPYAMTGGRTRPTSGGDRLDLMALVLAEAGAAADPTLSPEHLVLLALCEHKPLSVAELAADADLPVGVVRVLLGDLLELGGVRVFVPVPSAQLPDEQLLREVINGLRAL